MCVRKHLTNKMCILNSVVSMQYRAQFTTIKIHQNRRVSKIKSRIWLSQKHKIERNARKRKKNEKLKMKHFSFEHTLFHIARTQFAHKTKITKFGKKNSLFLLSEFSVQLLVFNKTKCKLSTSKQNWCQTKMQCDILSYTSCSKSFWNRNQFKFYSITETKWCSRCYFLIVSFLFSYSLTFVLGFFMCFYFSLFSFFCNFNALSAMVFDVQIERIFSSSVCFSFGRWRCRRMHCKQDK